MTGPEATKLARRIFAAIDDAQALGGTLDQLREHYRADRKRVARDLCGVYDHEQMPDLLHRRCITCGDVFDSGCSDAARYVEALTETGDLYAVQP